MKVIQLILLLFAFNYTSAQSNHYPDSSCLNIVKQSGIEWRRDSLGINGYRYANYHKFLGCRLGYLYPDYLLSYIGMPNEVWSTESDSNYIFYISKKTLLSGSTKISNINFKATSPENYIVKVEIGEIIR